MRQFRLWRLAVALAAAIWVFPAAAQTPPVDPQARRPPISGDLDRLRRGLNDHYVVTTSAGAADLTGSFAPLESQNALSVDARLGADRAVGFASAAANDGRLYLVTYARGADGVERPQRVYLGRYVTASQAWRGVYIALTAEAGATPDRLAYSFTMARRVQRIAFGRRPQPLPLAPNPAPPSQPPPSPGAFGVQWAQVGAEAGTWALSGDASGALTGAIFARELVSGVYASSVAAFAFLRQRPGAPAQFFFGYRGDLSTFQYTVLDASPGAAFQAAFQVGDPPSRAVRLQSVRHQSCLAVDAVGGGFAPQHIDCNTLTADFGWRFLQTTIPDRAQPGRTLWMLMHSTLAQCMDLRPQISTAATTMAECDPLSYGQLLAVRPFSVVQVGLGQQVMVEPPVADEAGLGVVTQTLLVGERTDGSGSTPGCVGVGGRNDPTVYRTGCVAYDRTSNAPEDYSWWRVF
ncbi:MAG: hypothetical protein GC189_04100 [Alphaproteobacteria bacterium]|nr:hypothetical protein [Alphaproteobacteria bacterium]